MTTTSHSVEALPHPRRSVVPASLIQWLIWGLVVTLVLGPFLPLLYASLRDRPLYEAGGVFTTEPYGELFGDRLFW
jgi:iron(III) transport system permease protein